MFPIINSIIHIVLLFIWILNWKREFEFFFLNFEEISNNQSPLLTLMLWKIIIIQITNKLFQKSINLVSIIYLIIRNNILVEICGKFHSSCLYIIIILSIYIMRLLLRYALLPFY